MCCLCCKRPVAASQGSSGVSSLSLCHVLSLKQRDPAESLLWADIPSPCITGFPQHKDMGLCAPTRHWCRARSNLLLYIPIPSSLQEQDSKSGDQIGFSAPNGCTDNFSGLSFWAAFFAITRKTELGFLRSPFCVSNNYNKIHAIRIFWFLLIATVIFQQKKSISGDIEGMRFELLNKHCRVSDTVMHDWALICQGKKKLQRHSHKNFIGFKRCAQ